MKALTKLKPPLLVINLKAYKQSFGLKALQLARQCLKLSKQFKVNIAIAPQHVDIALVANTGIATLAQHVDVTFGRYTGWQSSFAVKQAGCVGTMLNHSEHKLGFKELKQKMLIAKQAGLKTLVCAATVKEATRIAKLEPDIIAVEPPELIAGKVSVSTAKPGLIAKTVRAVKKIDENIIVLCGAGVKSSVDVSKALQLGAEGVLVSSCVAKSNDKVKVLKSLLEGFQKS